MDLQRPFELRPFEHPERPRQLPFLLAERAQDFLAGMIVESFDDGGGV
jgi:hypothetical protein